PPWRGRVAPTKDSSYETMHLQMSRERPSPNNPRLVAVVALAEEANDKRSAHVRCGRSLSVGRDRGAQDCAYAVVDPRHYSVETLILCALRPASWLRWCFTIVHQICASGRRDAGWWQVGVDAQKAKGGKEASIDCPI